MILLVHILVGATIASKIQNPILAIILAFLSHYFLDFIPHSEYPIDNLKRGRWKNSLPDILRIIFDFCSGILLLFLFSDNQPIIYVCAFFAILPDGLTILSHFFPNKILEIHNNFHRKKIHFLKHKKISNFWRILSQILVAIISVILI